MSWKINQLRQHINNKNLQLARLNENNQPVSMSIQQLEQKTSERNKHLEIYKLLSNLTWEEKFQWVNIKRLKANCIFRQGNLSTALECYLQSLIGLELKNSDPDKLAQVKYQLQFPILMNIAACFYKLKQYQKGIGICDQVLNDPFGKNNYQAMYKKAYFLYEINQPDQAKKILQQLNLKLDKNPQYKKISKDDIKQLQKKILSRANEQKSIYKRIFYQQEDDLRTNDSKQQDQPVLQYHENFIKRSIIWFKQILQSCYKANQRESIIIGEEDENSAPLIYKRQ